MWPLRRYNIGRILLSRKKEKKPKKKIKTTKKTILSPPHPQNTYTARETTQYVSIKPI